MLFAKEIQISRVYVSLQSQGIFTPSKQKIRGRKIALRDEQVMLRPRDKFHTLIRADSLNNHRWQETEAKFLSYSSASLPPQDRWKASLPPGQNTTAPRPRHI